MKKRNLSTSSKGLGLAAFVRAKRGGHCKVPARSGNEKKGTPKARDLREKEDDKKGRWRSDSVRKVWGKKVSLLPSHWSRQKRDETVRKPEKKKQEPHFDELGGEEKNER